MLVRKASSESTLGLSIKTVGLGEGIGIGIGTGSSTMESITQTMLRGSGSMPIHTLGNDDTTEKEKENERKEKKGTQRIKRTRISIRIDHDEPDTYRAPFARLNRAARDTSLSSFAVGNTNGITLDTYTDLGSNYNNSDAQELLRSQLHAVRLRLYLRL